MRRLLLFLALLGGGLLAVSLLSDDPAGARGGPPRLEAPATGGAAPLAVTGGDSDDATRVHRIGELDVPVMRRVEVAPGVFEERLAYRIRVREARPGVEGRMDVDAPRITLFDLLTGDELGWLTALRGWVLTQGAPAGQLQLSLDELASDTFALEGDVRGLLRTAEGDVTLEAGRLDVTGRRATAPGPVVLARGPLRLAGVDLVIDEASATLVLVRDVVLSAGPGAAVPGRVTAPAGLTWTVPGGREGGGRGHGELRGPVEGVADDGTRFHAQRLLLDADASLFTLLTAAWAERPGAFRVQGSQLSLGPEDGRLSLVQAEDARLEQLAPGGGGWLESASLTQAQGRFLSPGPARFGLAGVEGRSADLRWDRVQGVLEASADVHLAVTAGRLAGAWLDAAGGMSIRVPPDAPELLAAARGVLHGPIRGGHPDGAHLSCERIELDGPESGLSLVGSAHAAHADGRTLSAQRLRLLADELGRPVDLAARGQVVWLGPAVEPRWSMESAALDVIGRVVTSPAAVSITRGGLAARSTGLRLDEAAGRLSLERDVDLTWLDGAGAPAWSLRCDGPFTWDAPPGGEDPLAEGRGEARGRVVAEDGAGSRSVTELLLIDGPQRMVSLRGPSSLEQAGEGWTVLRASEHITARRDELGALATLDAQGDVSGERVLGDERLAFDARALFTDRAAGTLVLDGPLVLEHRVGERSSRLASDGGSRLVATSHAAGELHSLTGEGRFEVESGQFTVEADQVDWDLPADHLVFAGDCVLRSFAGASRSPRVEVWPRARRWFVPLPEIVLEPRR